jgi:hypothetical protein
MCTGSAATHTICGHTQILRYDTYCEIYPAVSIFCPIYALPPSQARDICPTCYELNRSFTVNDTFEAFEEHARKIEEGRKRGRGFPSEGELERECVKGILKYKALLVNKFLGIRMGKGSEWKVLSGWVEMEGLQAGARYKLERIQELWRAECHLLMVQLQKLYRAKNGKGVDMVVERLGRRNLEWKVMIQTRIERSESDGKKPEGDGPGYWTFSSMETVGAGKGQDLEAPSL